MVVAADSNESSDSVDCRASSVRSTGAEREPTVPTAKREKPPPRKARGTAAATVERVSEASEAALQLVAG